MKTAVRTNPRMIVFLCVSMCHACDLPAAGALRATSSPSRPGASAAFTVEIDGRERLVIVAEVAMLLYLLVRGVRSTNRTA